jgi:hypothetical protein
MKKIMLTAAGLSSVALCSAAMADVDVAFDVTGPGGNQVDYAVDMTGTLGDANITCDFVNSGGFTWAGDLLIGLVDPNGNAVEYGGYNLSFGYSSAGDFPSSWDSSSSGSYTHSFSLAGYGVEGSGTWTVQFADGYSAGSSADHFTGNLTLVGMDGGGGGDPYGGCCYGTDCSTGTEADCGAGGGAYLGDGTNCDGWPCGGAPEGACCFGSDCVDSDINDCASLGGDFAGEGTTCAGGACDAEAGDTCASAVSVGAGSHAFDTATATDSGFGEPDDMQCEGTYLDWQASPDRWFKWTAPDNGDANFNTCDANSYDTSLVLYEGANCSSLVQIACNGDAADSTGCQAYHSDLTYYVTNGQTYFIRLGGWQAAAGAGTLNIDFGGGGDPTGACCMGGDCSVQTNVNCMSIGGEYYGDGSACGDVDCGGGEPMGACCIGEDCVTMTGVDCDSFGGEFQGPDSDCGTTDCGGGPDGQPMTFATIGSGLVDDGSGNWTVDLFVLVGEGGRLDAVAGTGNQSKMLMNSGDFYQSAYGGPTSMDVNPAFYGVEPNLEWDSRVTIGAIDSTGNPYGENALQNIGIDWDAFENGGDMVTDNGTWFILPTDGQGDAEEIMAADCSMVHAVRIARLTATNMDDVITFEGLVQGRNPDGSLFNDSAYIETGYVAMEDCNDNGVNDTCDIANGSSTDSDGNGIPDECENTCPGDANGDGMADVDDILAVIGSFGGGAGPADVNNDGVVNVDDLLQVISWFGGC